MKKEMVQNVFHSSSSLIHVSFLLKYMQECLFRYHLLSISVTLSLFVSTQKVQLHFQYIHVPFPGRL